MRRIGKAVALLLALAALPAGAVEFSQSVDRTTVGTEDTFRLTVTVADAPTGAQVQFPAPNDFEVLSQSQSSQMSFSMGGAGRQGMQRQIRYTLVMRANRAGTLTIPPAVLTTGTRTYKTEAIQLEVKRGRVRDPQAGAPRGSPDPRDLFDQFRNFPGFSDDDDEAPAGDDSIPTPDVPRSDSDLFVRSHLDKTQLYVGEQATLSVYIFSRLDLSSVDAVTMPKLDGFWSEDLESPTQLAGEQRVLNGVPYRAYLLKRRALFPVKPGTVQVQPVEADITTGFLFAGHRVHRVGNKLEVKVLPLPAGAPPGFASANVGHYKLTLESSATQVHLGEPITVRVTLEGTGNVRNVAAPALTGPAALKVYEPTTTDKPLANQATLGGRRVQEYLVVPQQTGTFTLPALSLAYFDPQARRYEVSRTEAVTLSVLPGAGGTTQLSPGAKVQAAAPEAKNRLEATGLRPLRFPPRFEAPRAPVWSKPFFLPLVLAPVVAVALAGLATLTLRRRRAEDPAVAQRRRAKEAHARLAAAEQLLAGGSRDAFYGEVDKALTGFLEAQLGAPVGGLTQAQLEDRLAAAGLPAERRARVREALETCELGRYAPGGEGANRRAALQKAAAAMEGWPSR